MQQTKIQPADDLWLLLSAYERLSDHPAPVEDIGELLVSVKPYLERPEKSGD